MNNSCSLLKLTLLAFALLWMPYSLGCSQGDSGEKQNSSKKDKSSAKKKNKPSERNAISDKGKNIPKKKTVDFSKMTKDEVLEHCRKQVKKLWPESQVEKGVVYNRLGHLEFHAGVLGIRTKILSLAGIEGLLFNSINLEMTKINDIGPLRGMPLKVLNLRHTQVSDLSPLAGMKLESLHCNSSRLSDFRMLKGMPLRYFSASFAKDLHDVLF